jgi:hypothetical protein
MAQNDIKELLTLSSTSEDSVIAKAFVKTQGRLGVLATLLSISQTKSKE